MGAPVSIVLKWTDIFGWFPYHLKRKSIKQYMIENNTVPVTINDKLSAEINGIVRKVIRLNKRGIFHISQGWIHK